MKKKYFVLSIILTLFCLGASFHPFGCNTTISGTVTGPDDQPISGAVVTIDEYTNIISSTTTNENGEYIFEDIPYGDYTIAAAYANGGYSDQKQISTSYSGNGIACKEIDGDIKLGWQRINWEEIGTGSASGGGISNAHGCSGYPSLAISNSGNPVVAWSGEDFVSGNDEVYIKKWSGSNWVEVGNGSGSGSGISSNSGCSKLPSLAINSSGNPVVIWQDDTSGNNEIYFKQWNGTGWEELSNSASGSGISNNSGCSENPSLVMNDSGNPAVAWSDDTSGNYEIYIRQWNGTTWEEIGSSASGGGVSNNSGNSKSPSLALDKSGKLVVAWDDHTSGKNQIYIKKWNGSSWEEVGAGSASGGGISNNSGWGSSSPSLAINNAGNSVVAWEDCVGDYTGGYSEIYVKQWNGSSWEEVGAGSASGGGISERIGFSASVSLVINNSGYPVVAWDAFNAEIIPDNQIYIKQWNGTEWEELGGSGSGRGVSNTPKWCHAVSASLAINNTGNPVVAWEDSSSNHSEIYVRQYVPD